MSKIYNDAVFGGIKWSPDLNKIVFIGEIPSISKYESFFKDSEENEKDGKDEKKE